MDSDYTLAYEGFEHGHWWFRARRAIIERFLTRYSPAVAGPRWLDVGCGTGVLLESYGRIKNKIGVEGDAGSVERAVKKGLDVRQTEREWDFSGLGQFDVITLCDVIEHVEHDAAALAAVAAAVRPGGIVLVTVPALPGLWSEHDVTNQHYRRYTRGSLLRLFEGKTWEVLRSTYFSTFLLPGIWGVRQAKRLRKQKGASGQGSAGHDFAFGPRWLDWSLEAVFRLEGACLPRVSMPIGSSLLVVARRKEGACP